MMALPATVLEAEAGGLNGVGWCLHAYIRRCRRQLFAGEGHIARAAACARWLARAASATGFHLRPLLLGDRRWSIISR
jgi:hypothetical protein